MSPRRQILVAAFGLLVGIGVFTFVYARGGSYLTNDPQACANCHVMEEQLSGWTKSSHHAVAVCNDCHAPHTFFGKYSTKALNGFFHSWAFTTGRFPDPIQITPRNRQIAEAACRHCHGEIVEAVDSPRSAPAGAHQAGESCLRCHSEVGHR